MYNNFSICIFVYIASTSFQELFFLRTIFKPFYSPIIWILQLLYNLLIKKVYLVTDRDNYTENNRNGFSQLFHRLLNFIRRKKEKNTT